MSLLTDCRTHLLGDTTVAGLVGSRIFYGALPQAIGMPAVTLELSDSRMESRTLAATGSVYRSEVDILAYGNSEPSVESLGDAIYDRIEFNSGTWGTTTIQRAMVEYWNDLIQDPRDGGQAWRFLRVLSCVVWHE